MTTAAAFILDPDEPDMHVTLRAVPQESGIYALWSEADRLLYIGLSRTLASRLIAHRNARVFSTGYVIPWAYATIMLVPDGLLRDIEIAHIHALAPPYNRLYEVPEWTGHDAQVESIRARWAAIERKQAEPAEALTT